MRSIFFSRDLLLIGINALATLLLYSLDAVLTALYVTFTYIIPDKSNHSNCGAGSSVNASMMDLQVLRRLFWNRSNVGVGNRLTSLELPKDLAIVDGVTAEKFNEWLTLQSQAQEDALDTMSDEEATIIDESPTREQSIRRWASARMGFSNRKRSTLFEDRERAHKLLPRIGISRSGVGDDDYEETVPNVVEISKYYRPKANEHTHDTQKSVSNLHYGKRLYNAIAN